MVSKFRTFIEWMAVILIVAPVPGGLTDFLQRNKARSNILGLTYPGGSDYLIWG